MNWLSSVADIPGLRVAAVFLVGLVGGVWLNTFVRRWERKAELQLECSNLRGRINVLEGKDDPEAICEARSPVNE